MWVELPARLSRSRPNPNGLIQEPIVQDLGVHPVMVNIGAIHTIIPDPEDKTQTKLFVGPNAYDILEPYEKVRRLILGTAIRSTVE